MRLAILLLVFSFGLVIILSGCGDSTTPTKPGTQDTSQHHDSTGDTTHIIDSAFTSITPGEAVLWFNDTGKHTCNNNFILYDTVNKLLDIQLGFDNTSALIFYLEIPGLTPGLHTYPPESGAVRLSGSLTPGWFQLLNGYSASMDIKAVDLSKKKISAVLNLYLKQPVAGVSRITRIAINEGNLVIVPDIKPEVFGCSIDGAAWPTYPPGKIFIFTPRYFFGTPIQVSLSGEIGTSGFDGHETIGIYFDPTPGFTGTYFLTTEFQSRFEYSYQRRNPSSGALIDSTYSARDNDPLTLVITDFDKSKRMISGTFSGRIYNNVTSNPLTITNGKLENVILRN